MFNLDRFFRKKKLNPAVDSDGGGDYVDSTDVVYAAWLNLRWNAIHDYFKDLQNLLRVMEGGQTQARTLAKFYPPESNNQLNQSGEIPFRYRLESGTLNFSIVGEADTILLQHPAHLEMPSSLFVDLIDEDNLQFSIASGNTNLFEIQNDYPTGIDAWYRLGHDGAETTPAVVIVEYDIGTAQDYVSAEIEFEDYQNNPSSKPQRIGIKDNTKTVYIEILLESGTTNYRLNIVLDDGVSGTNSYLNVDTGVARSTDIHKLQIIGLETGENEIYLDGSLVWSSSSAEYLTNIELLYFQSDNDSGSQDYFDVRRFNLYKNYTFTPSANTRVYIYIDLSDYQIKSTTTRATAIANFMLYTLVIPAGSTALSTQFVTDHRTLNEFRENAMFAGISHSIFFAAEFGGGKSDSEIQAAINAAEAVGGGTVVLGAGTWTLTADVTLKDNVTILGQGATIAGGYKLSGSSINDSKVSDIIFNQVRVYYSGCSRIEVSRCRFTGQYPDDTYVTETVNCEFVTFEGNIFEESYSGTATSYAAIRIYATTASTDYDFITIKNNSFNISGTPYHGVIVSHSGTGSPRHRFVTISNNKFVNSFISFGQGKNSEISGNKFDSPVALSCGESENIVISHNQHTKTGSSDGPFLNLYSGADNITIENNVATGAFNGGGSYGAIYISDGTYNNLKISENILEATASGDYCIITSGTVIIIDCIISDNILVADNSGTGIALTVSASSDKILCVGNLHSNSISITNDRVYGAVGTAGNHAHNEQT